MNAERSCAILLRMRPSGQWEFISYTLREEVAWRSAEMYLLDEKARGHLQARVAVVLREDYDAGRIKPLRPPEGFATVSAVKPTTLELKVLPDIVCVDEYRAVEAPAEAEPKPRTKRSRTSDLDI